MDIKICSNCKIEKDINDFYIQNHKPISKCKECVKAKVNKYRMDNLDVVKERKKTYYKNNKEHCNEKSKEFREKNIEYNKEYQKKYKDNNKELVKEQKRTYYLNNREKVISNVIQYRKNRKKIDKVYKLTCSIRRLINNSIKRKNYTKRSKTRVILGCSFEEFKIHIESKHEDWMTWDNKGLYNGEFYYGWDIDHIIPISSAETEEDVIRLNHFSNLQPLCSKINRDIKKDNY
jgi:hypothetical protein